MTTSRASREELEAAHERVRAEAQDQINRLAIVFDELLAGYLARAEAAEAELAALRRVEAENLHMSRLQNVLPGENRWCIGDANEGVVGWGMTMADALSVYDARKEQGHG